MTNIAVLIPVLARPHNAETVVLSIQATSDARIVFICTQGDTDQIVASQATGQETFVCPFPLQPGDWARKTNWGLTQTEEPYVLLGADDLHFHQAWDKEALGAAEATGAGVIGTNDLGNKYVMRGTLSTHPLVARWYAEEWGTIDEPGKILHEGYFHNWVDAELAETAKARGQWTFAPRSVVEHMHPLWGKSEMDATYDRGLDQKRFEQDRRLLQQRRRLWRGRLMAEQRRQRQRAARTRRS